MYISRPDAGWVRPVRRRSGAAPGLHR